MMILDDFFVDGDVE